MHVIAHALANHRRSFQNAAAIMLSKQAENREAAQGEEVKFWHEDGLLGVQIGATYIKVK